MQECQKAAWPQHKRACTSSSSTSPRLSSNGSSTTTSPRSSQANGSSSKTPGSVLDALKQVLQQHSTVSADDPLQQQFEQAVLLFVSGEHRSAAAALQGVQAAAEAQGKKAVAGAWEAVWNPLCVEFVCPPVLPHCDLAAAQAHCYRCRVRSCCSPLRCSHLQCSNLLGRLAVLQPTPREVPVCYTSTHVVLAHVVPCDKSVVML